MRSVHYRRGDWLVDMAPATSSLSSELDPIGDLRDLEILFRPFAPLINAGLRCPLLNWSGHQSALEGGGFEAALAQGLGNIPTRRNSVLRKHASDSADNPQCLDQFRDGDGGVFRIWRRGFLNLTISRVDK